MSTYGANLEQLVARHLAGLNLPPSQPPSALSDLDAFVRSLPPEERRALDSDSQIVAARNTLLLSFLEYLLGTTPYGNAFAAGAGAGHAQTLLDTVKTAHREIAGKLANEQQEAQRRGAELETRYADLEARNADLERKYMQLCEQLGVTDAANA